MTLVSVWHTIVMSSSSSARIVASELHARLLLPPSPSPFDRLASRPLSRSQTASKPLFRPVPSRWRLTTSTSAPCNQSRRFHPPPARRPLLAVLTASSMASVYVVVPMTIGSLTARPPALVLVPRLHGYRSLLRRGGILGGGTVTERARDTRYAARVAVTLSFCLLPPVLVFWLTQPPRGFAHDAPASVHRSLANPPRFWFTDRRAQ